MEAVTGACAARRVGAGATKGAGAGALERRPASVRGHWRPLRAPLQHVPAGANKAPGAVLSCRRSGALGREGYEPCGPCVPAWSVRSLGARPARARVAVPVLRWHRRLRRPLGGGVEAVPRIAAPTSARQCYGGHWRYPSATRPHVSSGAIMVPGAVRPGCGAAGCTWRHVSPGDPTSPGAVPPVC